MLNATTRLSESTCVKKDLIFDGHHEGRTPTHGYAGDARGGDGGVRQELAAGVVQLKPKTEVEATSILPSLNGKTARS